MGNLPAKITGKYQSYDINTPSYVTPPLNLRRPSTTNPYYNEQSNNTLSKSSPHQQKQNYQENNRYNQNNHRNDFSREGNDFNRHHNEDDFNQIDEDENHHKAWREQIQQRNSKHDSFNEEIFNSSQQKLEESIYTENPTIRDSRIMEGSIGEPSPSINKLRRHHIEDDDDEDEGIINKI